MSLSKVVDKSIGGLIAPVAGLLSQDTYAVSVPLPCNDSLLEYCTGRDHFNVEEIDRTLFILFAQTL